MHRTALKLLCVWLSLCLFAPSRALSAARGDEPPRFEVPEPGAGAPLVFVVYGDTRFSRRDDVVNAPARRALVGRIARENPAAILIGGDLVYEGSNPQDYDTYKSETIEWARRKIPVFPALGNHEFRGCATRRRSRATCRATPGPCARGSSWSAVTCTTTSATTETASLTWSAAAAVPHPFRPSGCSESYPGSPPR